MKREQAQELFSDFQEGTLTPALRLALEQHFEAEPASRLDYEQFARVYQLLFLPDSETVEVPHGFRASVLERVASEQAKRPVTAGERIRQSLGEWFGIGARRQMTGGAFALACLVLVGFVLRSHVSGTGPSTSSFGGSTLGPVEAAMIPTTIQSVSTKVGVDGNLYHLFHVHLPTTVPSATVTASVLDDVNEITDAGQRIREATPALKQPLTLQNDEEMQIPVAVLRSAPAGTTLNVFVQWQGEGVSGASGSQVVFTPVQTDTPSVTAPAMPVGFYQALQAISAFYGVTVIADAGAPATTIDNWPGTPDAQSALKSVAGSVGYEVKLLSNGTYQVYKP